MFIHTGDYIEHASDGASQTTYYTFTPLPLLEGDFYSMNDDLSALLAATHRALGILEGMIQFFPDRGIFENLMLFRESCFSKMIDYTNFDFYSALTGRSMDGAKADIFYIESAYQYAMGSNNKKVDFNKITSHALYGRDSKQKATTRLKPMFWKSATSNYRQYNPTAPKYIFSALHDINKYIESVKADALIRAAMCHYQFEMIHPYDCYNGISGRILVYKVLNDSGMHAACYLSLSECLYYHRAEYFEKLGATQKSGDYQVWIEFFIRMICEAAKNSSEHISVYETITKGDIEDIMTLRTASEHTMGIYLYFKAHVVSSVKQTSQQLKLSFNVVSRAIEALQSLGILTQITDGSRNRLFAHTELMRLILPQ